MEENNIGRNFIPPIGLSVYEMYGKSESEQTLIGGETGRDGADKMSSGCDCPDTEIVLPRCSRETPPALMAA